MLLEVLAPPLSPQDDIMLSPLELVKLVQAHNVPESEQAEVLAALADAPPEDFAANMPLPTPNKLPAFKLGGKDLGSILAGKDYGMAAPLPGEKMQEEPTIGQLLVGEM